MRVSNELFDPTQLYWQDYLPLLQQFEGHQFPNCDQLNSQLPDGLVSQGGHAIRFVPSNELGDEAYEHRIYTSGQVSTRTESWHDLFNALVWMRFPQIKTAMNALHFQAFDQQSKGSRGHLRDALTLFDECGVLVYSRQAGLLESLAERRWERTFQYSKLSWGTDIQIAISGHAMLEKYLSPYKSMTAKALLVQLDENLPQMSRNDLLKLLDNGIATQLLNGNILTTPASLAPLPLAGIPNWWPGHEQSAAFYNDPQVFRPPPAGLQPMPVIRV